jgi:hypothetical protein
MGQSSFLTETMATLSSTNSRAKEVTSQFQVNPQKVVFLPLHIKHGLMKYSMKTMDKNGSRFFLIKTVISKGQ